MRERKKERERERDRAGSIKADTHDNTTLTVIFKKKGWGKIQRCENF